MGKYIAIQFNLSNYNSIYSQIIGIHIKFTISIYGQVLESDIVYWDFINYFETIYFLFFTLLITSYLVFMPYYYNYGTRVTCKSKKKNIQNNIIICCTINTII